MSEPSSIQRNSQEADLKDLNAALSIYKPILNFNFVGKYDPKLKKIINQTSHVSLLKFDIPSNEWEQLEYQGPFFFYERNVEDVDENGIIISTQRYLTPQELSTRDNYSYGLMIANRQNPKNISLGIIPKKVTAKYRGFFPRDYKITMLNELLTLENSQGDMYGFWIHDPEDRKVFYSLISYAIDH